MAQKKQTKVAPSAAAAFPVETLKVEGNTHFPTEKILAVAGLKVGSPAAKESFEAAREHLLATGAFHSVGYEYKPSAAGTGYDATFQVVEVEQLFPYRFEDLPGSEEALRAGLRKQEPLFGDQIPASAEVLNRFARTIEQLAGGGAKVVGKLSLEIPNQPAIVFRPATPRANVAEVRFAGNEVLPSTLLVNTLSGVAIGVPYSEPSMRLLVESSVRRLYEARGRIRVTFPKIAAEKSPRADVDGVVVTVTVNEGPSYSLGSVRFAGVSDAEELKKVADFRSKDLANFDDIQSGVDRVYQRYRGKGYLRVSGRIERQINDQQHTVDLVVTVEPGAQYLMGKLEIIGLDIMSEPPIRKVWALKPGAPFQPEYPDGFLGSLREQGVFENLGKTSSETHVDDQTHTVDVTLRFSGSAAKTDPK
jgi:outer membrane protein assembly factor BamA